MKIIIKLWNSLSCYKEAFIPIKPGEVGIYACGPTVYDYPHIGNLRTYLMVDLLNRVLKSDGLEVNLVMNITDVGHLVKDLDQGEDKIELKARKTNSSAWEIAKFYEKAFQEDLKDLNILNPTHMPKATDHIPDMINLISQIEKNGYTYQLEDGIYFDTSLDPDYSKFAKLDLAGQIITKEEIKVNKKNPADFALWKFSKPDVVRQMIWDSPWGKGFPGWHIECSAMSVKYLGQPFDIHTGGVDHIPVHHTNEIAQTKAASSKPLANVFVHFEHLLFDGKKMAKSDETYIRLQDIVSKGFSPRDFRYLCLTSHYRERLNFTWESLKAARNTLERIDKLCQEEGIEDKKAYEEAFKIIADDLASPDFLAFLHTKNNPWLWKTFEDIHGLQLGQSKKDIQLTPKQEELIRQRQEYRKAGNFKASDEVRDLLMKEGISIEDTPQGYNINQR